MIWCTFPNSIFTLWHGEAEGGNFAILYWTSTVRDKHETLFEIFGFFSSLLGHNEHCEKKIYRSSWYVIRVTTFMNTPNFCVCIVFLSGLLCELCSICRVMHTFFFWKWYVGLNGWNKNLLCLWRFFIHNDEARFAVCLTDFFWIPKNYSLIFSNWVKNPLLNYRPSAVYSMWYFVNFNKTKFHNISRN